MRDHAEALHASTESLAPVVARRGTRFCVVLGSGLGSLADALDRPESLAMAEVPGFPEPAVAGHGGQIVFGSLAGVECAVLKGRVHLYEGRSPDEVVHGVRSFVGAGVRTVVLTNAAGGVAENLKPGTLLSIVDHLNYTGAGPFEGPLGTELGPRFPSMATVWDKALVDAASTAARQADVQLASGVYAGLKGPAYETPAEVRALRVLGASAVGMSTVLEAMAASHMGARVAGFSVITNSAGSADDAHDAVLRASEEASADLVRVITGMVNELAAG